MPALDAQCGRGGIGRIMKVYGPYIRKDGRKHVILYDPKKGIRRTKSYPKYLLEKKLGRDLDENETCDHIDEDFTNDDTINLQPLTRGENIKKATKQSEVLKFLCPNCRKSFKRFARDYRWNQLKQKKSGPYCSRRCAGQFTYVNPHLRARSPNGRRQQT